jgi:hypothetical protein
MLDSYLARYGNQDIRWLRGVTQLSYGEKLVFAGCLERWMRREVVPMQASFESSQITDDYDDS